MYTATDHSYQTFAWASNVGAPNLAITYNFTSSEVVLGTVTFSGSINGATISAIDYQNQVNYGGNSDAAIWTLQVGAAQIDVTDYASLFYQSATSDVPVIDNDGGVSNQRLSLISSPLPISLSDFTAQLNNKHTVDLDWVTQTEVNSKGFDIERSSNGRDFQKIAFVSSKAIDGNSTAKLVYASEDLNPVTGDNYYRLKEISMDGKATYSVVRKVIVPGNKQLISLYPNPANSFVNIKGLQEGNMIRVYDMTGKMILEKKAAESQLMQIDVSGIANGNYQVAVFNNDSRVFTGKLVKHD
jgi:hypothetical protein